MAGVWDAPPTADEKKAVWDAPPTAAELGQPSKEVGLGESALRGAGQGLTMGFSDELAGLGAPVSDAIFEALHPDAKKIPAAQAYAEVRDSEREANKAAQDQHSRAYLGGQLAGGVVGGTALGGAAAPFKAAQGATWLGKAGAAAANGSLLGGVAGAGTSEAQDLTGLAADTGKGAAIGGVLGGGISALGSAASNGSKAVAKYIKALAERRAVKATGLNKGDFMRLADNPGGYQQAGRDLLDQGIVTPLANREQIAERIAGLKSRTGGDIGDILAEADEKVPGAFGIEDFLAKANKAGVGGLRDRYESGAADQLQGYLGQIGDRETMAPPTLETAARIKDAIQKKVYGITGLEDANATPFKAGLRDSLGVVTKQMDQGVDAAGLSGEYGEAKRLYGSLADLSKAAEGGVGREQANRVLSPSDHALGLGTLITTHNPALAIGAGLANKVARGYGNQLSAVGLDKLGGALRYRPELLGSANPSAVAGAEAAASSGFDTAFPGLRAKLAREKQPQQQQFAGEP